MLLKNRLPIVFLMVSLVAGAKSLDRNEWSYRMATIPNLSLETLLSQNLIRETSDKGVFEPNLGGLDVEPKERKAVRILHETLQKPILLVARLPGFLDTPMVDAIVFDKEGHHPEFNLNLKSLTSRSSDRMTRDYIKATQQNVNDYYSDHGLDLLVPKILEKRGIVVKPNHLWSTKVLLGLTNDNRRPFAMSFDYVGIEDARSEVVQNRAVTEPREYLLTQRNTDWRFLINLEKLKALTREKPWTYFFFIFKSKVMELDEKGWVFHDITTDPSCDPKLSFEGGLLPEAG